MMKKRVIAMIMSALVGIASLSGCGPKNVEYPSEGMSVETKDSVPSHLSDVVESNSGKILCDIDADVVCDLNTPYPVYELEPIKYSDEDLAKLFESIFDNGDYTILNPICFSGSDYFISRRETLEDRKNQILQSGEEVPPYIDEELKQISIKERNSSSDNIVIPYTGETKWYCTEEYLSEIYGDTAADLRYCFAEGKIGGELFCVNITDFFNCVTILGYKHDCNPEEPDNFMVQKVTDNDDSDPVINDKNEAECNEILKRLGISSYDCIGQVDAKLYGQINQKGETLLSEKGVVRYYAPNVEGKSRPLNFYNDCFFEIENYTKFIPTGHTMQGIGAIYTNGIGKDSFTLGFESVYVCMSKDGVNSFAWSSPCKTTNIDTKDAKLLDFESVIDRIGDNFSQLYSAYPDYFAGVTPKIECIELGMCRMTKDNVNYVMVPAWYIYFSDDTGNLAMPAAEYAINAVDGTIINVVFGGTTELPF